MATIGFSLKDESRIGRSVIQVEVLPDQALAMSATIRGIMMGNTLGRSESSVSLFLDNTGTTAPTVTVTYEVGFFRNNSNDTIVDNIRWVTPENGGAISNLTAKSLVANTSYHESLNLPTAQFYRFTIVETGVAASTVALYAHIFTQK